MHRSVLLVPLFAAAVLAHAAPSTPSLEAAPATAPSPGSRSGRMEDEAGARIPLEAYLRGHATGDSAAFRRAFWKEAKLWFVRDGALMSRTADDYIGAASGRPAADEAKRKRRIVSLQVTGNAAIATIELDYPTAHFIDYMTLLKVGEEWRIINKSFFVTPRTTP